MRSKTTTMEMCTWKMGQQRKRKRILNRTGPTTKAPTPRNESTGKRKGDNKKNDSDKGDSKRDQQQNKGSQ
jgi:hypothetical protein